LTSLPLTQPASLIKPSLVTAEEAWKVSTLAPAAAAARALGARPTAAERARLKDPKPA
jgi:hypothetical protein